MSPVNTTGGGAAEYAYETSGEEVRNRRRPQGERMHSDVNAAGSRMPGVGALL